MSFWWVAVDLIMSWFVLLIVSLVLHEWGHGLMLQQITGRKPVYGWDKKRWCFVVGTQSDYTVLSPKEKIKVYAAGILLGIIPIIGMSLLSYLYLPVLIAYVAGLKHDIKNIKECWSWSRIAW